MSLTFVDSLAGWSSKQDFEHSVLQSKDLDLWEAGGSLGCPNLLVLIACMTLHDLQTENAPEIGYVDHRIWFAAVQYLDQAHKGYIDERVLLHQGSSISLNSWYVMNREKVDLWC